MRGLPVRPHYIYGLFDPRTGDLRYVGKSDRPRARLANQMNERSNTHRCHWLQGLRAAGLRPVQVIMDIIPAGGDWQAAERAWIAAARAAGCPLVNGTDGGDGVPGLTGDSLRRLRATWKGRKHRPESLAKMSAGRKGRRHTAEHKARMSEMMRGREFTGEHRARLRAGVQKLADRDVHAIRRMLVAGVRHKDIAECFGIDKGSVSNIACGKTYTEVGQRYAMHPDWPVPVFDLENPSWAGYRIVSRHPGRAARHPRPDRYEPPRPERLPYEPIISEPLAGILARADERTERAWRELEKRRQQWRDRQAVKNLATLEDGAQPEQAAMEFEMESL